MPPPHPLAGLDPSEITSIVRLGLEGPQPLSGGELRRVATVIASLKNAPVLDGRSVVWGSATLWRAETRDGITLSLQVKPIAGGAAVRITADPSPGLRPGASGAASAIRGLRLKAYRLSSATAEPLLR